MKVTLPEDISDITLDQYQRFIKLSKREDLSELDYNKRVIKIFTGLKYSDVGNISHKDYADILKQITTAMNTDSRFVNRFLIEDVEFAFIPNLDEMSTAEFVDLSNWGVDVENFHKIMAILFRPITKTDSFDNYEIAGYQGSKEYADVMLRMPMNVVNGALGFFYHLAKELRIHTQKYTAEVQAKTDHLVTSKSGDGMQQLTN